MPDYIINPLTLNDPETDPKIKALLHHIVTYKKDINSSFFSRGTYTLEENGETISIEFTHDLVLRERNSHKGQYRLEVLAPKPFNHGGFGSLYDSLGVIMPELDYTFKEKPKDKSRVCKAIQYDENASTKEEISIESSYTKENHLLHSKDVVFDEKFGGYLVMRKVGDIDLFDFYDTIDDERLKLTLQQRLQLTYNILEAVKKQIYDLGLNHNDIKLENILINMKDLSVIIVDYAMAEKRTNIKKIESLRGTADYLAPEIYTDNERSDLSDVYATGIVIARLWGDISRNNMEKITNLDNILTIQREQKWNRLFKNIPSTKELQRQITMFIDCLTAYEPTTRFNITESLLYWKNIMKYHQEAELKVKFQSTKYFTPSYSGTSSQWMLNKPRPPRAPSQNTGITQSVDQEEQRIRTMSCK